MDVMWFFIGVVAGTCLGIVVAGILHASDDGSTDIKPEKRWIDE